jgi:hypothetical protein
MLTTVDDFLALITSWHATREKFVKVIETNVDPYVKLREKLYALIRDYDLDFAIGAQLDTVGEWIGRNRHIPVPLPDPWFSFDISKKGFDRGIWYQPYSMGNFIQDLDDEVFRQVLYCKIAFNQWDGTVEPAQTAVRQFFRDHLLFAWLEDRHDMSSAYCFVGTWVNLIFLVLLDLEFLAVGAAGIKTYIQIASVENTPLFGFDSDNTNVHGFDNGCWGVSASYLIKNII